MHGPEILARSLSRPFKPDAYGNSWQYHPRSDRHSKIACWGILFDLLANSELMRQHVAAGKVIFGVNHEMSDFKTGRKKNLDLVVATPGSADERRRHTFGELAVRYGITLTSEQSDLLRGLPIFEGGPVSSVLIALEAKAAMTEHGKARPRLYDELNSSHLTIHGSAPGAIAAGFVMVNVARWFISPDLNKFSLAVRDPVVTQHNQPRAAEIIIQKVREMPRKTRPTEEGFDAIGIVVVDCKNDGSPFEIVSSTPAPRTNDDYNYEQMVRRIRQMYEVNFGHI